MFKTARNDGIGAAAKDVASIVQTEAGKAYDATKSASKTIKDTNSHPIDATSAIIDGNCKTNS